MVRALRKGSFRQRGKSHWSWGCSAAVRVTPVSGKRQEPVLRLKAGQRPHSAHQMKGCGRAKSAHGHTLLASAAAGTPESRSHFPSKPSWAQRCAVPSFCYQMNWRNVGALKILKSSTGDLKRCCAEAVTLPKPEINMNQEAQQWRSNHSGSPKFSDSTNYFAPAAGGLAVEFWLPWRLPRGGDK